MKVYSTAAAVCIVLFAGQLSYAQSTNTSHIFPQIADGRQSDGMYYTSVMYVVNLSGSSASCTLSFYGMSMSRLAGSANFSVPSGYWYLNTTRGVDSLASGYAKVACSQPVYANLIYTLSRPDDSTAGMATVFSSPAVTYAHLPMLLAGDLRYGVAIANDNATETSISLLFTMNGQTTGRQISIPARSQFVGFVDQYLSIPSTQGLGTLEILSQSSQKVSVVGLLFSGTTFTTLVPSY